MLSWVAMNKANTIYSIVSDEQWGRREGERRGKKRRRESGERKKGGEYSLLLAPR